MKKQETHTIMTGTGPLTLPVERGSDGWWESKDGGIIRLTDVIAATPGKVSGYRPEALLVWIRGVPNVHSEIPLEDAAEFKAALRRWGRT